MSDSPVLRLLEVVCQKLGAVDARLEIGGRAPEADTVVWVTIEEHRRLVAVFEAPPADPEEMRERLSGLVDAFHEMAATPATRSVRPSFPPGAAQAALDGELAALSVAAGARCALIIDGSSPEVWGRSHETTPTSVDELLAVGAATIDWSAAIGAANATEAASAVQPPEVAARVRRYLGEIPEDEWDPAPLLLAARATSAVRAWAEEDPNSLTTLHRVEGHGTGFPWTAHALGGFYVLLMTFDERFSEPHAERAVRAVRSRLERLIGSLPPVDPPPKRGRVVRLHRD